MIGVLVGALSWTFVGPAGGDITSVSMEGSMAIAGSYATAYYSTDSALTWHAIDMTPYSPIEAFLTGFETAILNGQFMVFHSEGYIHSADGSSWTPVDVPGVRYVGEPSGNYVPFIAGNSVYLVSSSDFNPVQVFTPGVDTFLIAVGSLDSLWYAFARYITDSVIVYRGILDTVSVVGVFAYNGDINDVAINPYNPDEIILSTSGGLYMSTDGGATFSMSFTSLLSGLVVVKDVDYLSADSVVAGVFYYAGLYLGTRSLTGWTFNPVYSDAVVPDMDGNLIAALGRGVYYTQDGATFEERNQGLYAHVIYNPGMISNDRDDRLSFINTGGLALYSDDGGSTWNTYGYKMDIGTAIEVSPVDHQQIFIGGYKGSGSIADPGATVLVRSSDGGSTFDVLRDTSIFQALGLLPMEIQQGSNPNDVFMVSGNPGRWLMEYSSDAGTTFDSIMVAQGYNGFCFSCMDTLFMVLDTGDVYMSVDAGATWSFLGYIGYPGNVYLTYRDGYLYYSTGQDAYLRYIDVATGALDSMDLSSLFDTIAQVQVSVNGHFFLTGYQGGVYKVAYGSSPDNLTVEDAPASFGGLVPLASHVYFYVPSQGGFYVSPYPTNLREVAGRVTVRYTPSGILVEGVDGRMSIYNVGGKLVRTVEGNFIARGTLSPGVYVVRTQKGSFRILVR